MSGGWLLDQDSEDARKLATQLEAVRKDDLRNYGRSIRDMVAAHDETIARAHDKANRAMGDAYAMEKRMNEALSELGTMRRWMDEKNIAQLKRDLALTKKSRDAWRLKCRSLVNRHSVERKLWAQSTARTKARHRKMIARRDNIILMLRKGKK
jgi:hypothetical protein